MSTEGPKLTFLGNLLILLFIGACGYGAFLLFRHQPLEMARTAAPEGAETRSASAPGGSTPPAVEFGIAYGTEKQRWLEWAVEQYRATPAGAKVKVDLIPMGSLEGAQAVLAGDKRINVWSPASSLYEDVFIEEWQIKNNKSPIVRREALALTPMVFVSWAERRDAFVAKYKEITFQTIGQALREPAGWDAIAGKPEWGLFKFGHTHPNESNSGLMTLVLAAYDYHKKPRGLALKDILDPQFQSSLNGMENAITGMSNSTGNMMRDMVLRGPSTFDVLCVYENVVVDYLKSAEGRWGELHVDYPRVNMWNENPYDILDASWSTAEQRAAASAFLDFLLTEPIQRESLKHGFRPGNPNVPIKFPESPFVAYGRFGIKIEIGSVADAPKAEVINNLLAVWQRNRGSR